MVHLLSTVTLNVYCKITFFHLEETVLSKISPQLPPLDVSQLVSFPVTTISQVFGNLHCDVSVTGTTCHFLVFLALDPRVCQEFSELLTNNIV